MASEVWMNMRKPVVCSVWPEEDEGGRNRRRSMAAMEEKRRPCARFTGPWLDSLDGDDEDDETHRLVLSDGSGVVCSGGAMGKEVRWR
jgi:hypothetical protein